MQTLWLVFLGVICFLSYDVWTVSHTKKRWPQALFMVGILCDAVVTAWMLKSSVHIFVMQPLRAIIFGGLAFIFLILEIYTLFFALPFDDTYVDPTAKRAVCRAGMYALCRHPAVIWFLLFYLMLYLAAPGSATLWGGSALCAGNILYIIVQDCWTFPRTFSDYPDYRREAPFLFPTLKSITRAIHTWPKRRKSI